MNGHPRTIHPAILAILVFCGISRITELSFHTAAFIAGMLCLTAFLIDS